VEKIINILSEAPIFKGLSEKSLVQLRSIAKDKFYKKGTVVFSEGDEGDGFYVVADGRVKIFKMSSEGKEHILHIYGPGNPFGEVPVFSGQKLPANAQTLVKSHLLFFPRQSFVDLISTNPSLAMNMLAVLSKRLREFTVQIENLSLKEVPGRLAAHLIYLTRDQQNDACVRLPFSKGELASLLGTIPETLSRILNKMNGLGLIEVNGRQITILDIHGLSDLAQQGKI